MDRKSVLAIHDSQYAETYNERFHVYIASRPDTEYELRLLRQLLSEGKSWLDVGCGTGYCLSQFPEHHRAGLDISPDMLAQARIANPGVSFVQRDMVEESPEFNGQWDLVSCMWQAFGYLESLAEIRKLVGNLSRWTSQSGTCFVPLVDPRVISNGLSLPYIHPTDWEGSCSTRAITWAYTDEFNKPHDVISPFGEYMVELFEQYFNHVMLVQYPPLENPGWSIRRSLAVISTKKK
jgi:SAM-dependent methyltransferase